MVQVSLSLMHDAQDFHEAIDIYRDLPADHPLRMQTNAMEASELKAMCVVMF